MKKNNKPSIYILANLIIFVIIYALLIFSIIKFISSPTLRILLSIAAFLTSSFIEERVLSRWINSIVKIIVKRIKTARK